MGSTGQGCLRGACWHLFLSRTDRDSFLEPPKDVFRPTATFCKIAYVVEDHHCSGGSGLVSSSVWRFRLPSTTECPDHSAEQAAWCGRQAPLTGAVPPWGRQPRGASVRADLVGRVLGEEPQDLGPALRLYSVFYPLTVSHKIPKKFLQQGLNCSSPPAHCLNHKGAGLCFLSYYSLFH